MKSQILGFCVALVASLFVSVRGQCNVQCAAGQTVDCRTCACVNNIDCTNRTIVDSIECATLDCDSITTPLCPKKCLCQRPSVMTNYCSPCLNNGLLDKSTCKCTCPIGYQGSRLNLLLNFSPVSLIAILVWVLKVLNASTRRVHVQSPTRPNVRRSTATTPLSWTFSHVKENVCAVKINSA